MTEPFQPTDEQIAEKEKGLKDRLAHEKAKLETTVSTVKETKRMFDKISGEHCSVDSQLTGGRSEICACGGGGWGEVGMNRLCMNASE